MESTAKAAALARDLANKLQIRYANDPNINYVRQALDAAGWPEIFLSHGGVETEGNPVILIRIIGESAVSRDIFGNFTYCYAPHLLQFAYEMSATANDPIPLIADIITAEFESIKTGVRFQLYQLANGTAVTEANLDTAVVAGGATADLDELYWPTKLV
jgi:hypothetical protein